MGKVVLYIASSLDGYIAKPNGNLDWLTSVPNPESGDYGYQDLLDQTDIIIMGKSTYLEVLSFDIEWPYGNHQTFVVTHDQQFQPTTPHTFTLSSNIHEFVNHHKNKSQKNCWLVGGGKLISHFLAENLLDRMILTLIPITLGRGISLFPPHTSETQWSLIKTNAFNTGVVNLTYDKKSP